MTNNAMLLAPFSQEAEEATIGSVLISPTVFGALQGLVQMADFYLTRHRHMWKAFERISSRNQIMDLTTVSEELRQMGFLEEIGGYAYLIQLINNTPNSMHAEAYAQLVERAATRRRLLLAADTIRDAAMDEGMNIEEVLEVSEDSLAAASSSGLTLPGLWDISEAVSTYEQEIKVSVTQYQTNPNYIIGVRTGLTDLDMLIDGLQPGVTTIAGATGLGKSAAVGTFALNASRTGILRGLHEMPAQVVYFSGEMTQRQIMNRLVAQKTGLEARNLARGNLTTADLRLLKSALDDLKGNHKLAFESLKRMSIRQIRQRARSLVAYNEIDLLILDGLLQIDALQIDRNSTKREKQYMARTRRDAIEEIMNELETVSMDYKLPILLTHQISRAPSRRDDKRPVLNDLAEAIFVEQKSATVILMYRESYYKRREECENPDLTEFIVAKSRLGEGKTVRALYNAPYTRFENVDIEHISFED